MGYENTHIYVMQMRYTFQYMFAWKQDVYMYHVVLMPKLWRRILSFFRLINLYTREQLESGEQVILSGAMKTIDELKVKKQEKAKKVGLPKAKETDCMWMATFLGKEKVPHYHCVTHDETIPMEDGKRPHHDTVPAKK